MIELGQRGDGGFGSGADLAEGIAGGLCDTRIVIAELIDDRRNRRLRCGTDCTQRKKRLRLGRGVACFQQLHESGNGWCGLCANARQDLHGPHAPLGIFQRFDRMRQDI